MGDVSEWETTTHHDIQVRNVYKTEDELPLREYRHAYVLGSKLPPDRRDAPIFSLYEPLGYQVRVRKQEEEPEPDRIRCKTCRRCFKRTKAEAPRSHACVPTEPGWSVARWPDETPAKAFARGCKMLGIEAGEQIAWDVGDGKKRTAA